MIKAITTLSDNEFRIFLKYHLKKEKAVVKYAVPTSLFVAIVMVTGYIKEENFASWVLVSVMVLLALPVLVKHLILKGFRNNPSHNSLIYWEIDEVELRGRGAEFSISLQWSMFYETYITPEGILFYPKRHMFYWIPRGGFEKDSDFQCTVNLLSRRAPRLITSKDFKQ